MDPSKMPFQTFPHPNGHCGTIGPGGTVNSNGLMHQCPGTQTMVNSKYKYKIVLNIHSFTILY